MNPGKSVSSQEPHDDRVEVEDHQLVDTDQSRDEIEDHQLDLESLIQSA